MRIASMCAGGGGLDEGLALAVPAARVVVYVEREAFAAASLVSRMHAGQLHEAPIWDDIATFDGRPWRGVVDCLSGGTPCQDMSHAGKRVGLDGERSGLFWEFVRIAGEIQPEWIFWENVDGAGDSLPRVFDAFEALGYRGKAVSLRASDVGAPHERARYFLLAHAMFHLGGTWRSTGPGEAVGGRALGAVVGSGQYVAHRDVLGRSKGERRREAGGVSFAHSGGTKLADDEHRLEEQRRGGLLDRERAARGHDADGRGEGVGHADAGEQPRQHRAGRRPSRGTPASGAGRAVGDAGGGTLQLRREPGVLRREEREAGGAGDSPAGREPRPTGSTLLGDTRPVRLQGELAAGTAPGAVGRSTALVRPHESADASGSGGLPRPPYVWPPTRDDSERWRVVLAERPELAPAQPRVRRVADGLAAGEHAAPDLQWSDRLRLLGNGVVPAQAAEAFCFLFEALAATGGD